MSKVKEKNQKDLGITAGLLTGLFYLVCFLFLKYSLLLSLFFAILIATCLILIAFWYFLPEEIKTEEIVEQKSTDKEKIKQKKSRKNAPGLFEVQQKRKLEINNLKEQYQRQQKNKKIFGLFSRKKK